jgi:hypothetical protein
MAPFAAALQILREGAFACLQFVRLGFGHVVRQVDRHGYFE